MITFQPFLNDAHMLQTRGFYDFCCLTFPTACIPALITALSRLLAALPGEAPAGAACRSGHVRQVALPPPPLPAATDSRPGEAGLTADHWGEKNVRTA